MPKKSKCWSVGMRALLSLAAGIFLFFVPKLTFFAFIVFWVVYLLANGITNIFQAIFSRKAKSRWAALAFGFFEILVGLFVLLWPALSTLAVMYVVASWAVVVGMVQIWSGCAVSQDWLQKILLFGGGLVALGLAFMLFFSPASGILNLLWLLSLYLIVSGIIFAVQAVRIYKRVR